MACFILHSWLRPVFWRIPGFLCEGGDINTLQYQLDRVLPIVYDVLHEPPCWKTL